jgi:hypothetical protein
MTPSLDASRRTDVEALMVAAMDVPPQQESRFNAWYTHEHVPERLTVPGMLCAKRYVRSAHTGGSGLTYLAIYEAESLDVFTSPPYLRQLDAPTPLTRSVVRGRQESGVATRRAVLAVQRSFGTGIGRQMVYADFSAQDPDVVRWLLEGVVPQLVAAWEVCTVHVATVDDAATDAKQQTTDGRAFGATKRSAGVALIVDGTHRVTDLVGDLALEPSAARSAWIAGLRGFTSYDLLLCQAAPRGVVRQHPSVKRST